MKKIILCVIILLIVYLYCTPVIYAQCHTLSGYVLDEDEKEPLEFASIHIEEIPLSLSTNEKGEYTIKNICNGTYTIKVSHLGCDIKTIQLDIKGDAEINFYLPHHANQLKEVCIKEKKIEQQSTQSTNTLTGRDWDKVKGESLGKSLKTIAGVTSIETGNAISKPVIHGLHSNRILILNNEIRQEGQQWGSEHAPEIDPFIANKITVLKGANAVRYGSDAIAGVILVEPNPIRDSAGISGELNLVGFSNNQEYVISGIVEQNFKKIPPLNWRLQGTLKRGGNSASPNYYLKNTGLKEYNFSYGMGWNKETYGIDIFYSQFNTTLGIFSGSHIGSLTDLQAAFNMTEPLEKAGFTYEIKRPYQHIEHELFKTKARINTGDIGTLRLVYARQYNMRYEYDKHKPLNDSLATLNIPELKFEITTHTADLIWEHNRIESLSGTIGISTMTQGNTYEGRFFIPNFRSYVGGIFWIERWKKNKLEVEAGARYDYKRIQVYKYDSKNMLISPLHLFSNFSGTLGCIYKINPHFVFNINAGNAWRAPGVNELYSNGLHHGAASIEVGNENLITERAYNFISSVNYHDHKKIQFEISLYYNLINNFIYLQPTLPPTLTIKGAFPTFYYKQVNADFKGIDLLVSYDIQSYLTITSKASIIRAWNKTTNEYLILMPSDKYENTIKYELKDCKKIKKPYLSASATTITKQWRVPENSDYTPPPAGYTLINTNAGFILEIKKQYVEIEMSVNNLLNTVYRDYLNRFRYYCDGIGRNVSLKLKIPFNTNNKTTKN